MPDSDGWSILDSMRGYHYFKDTSIFIVSGMDPSDAPRISESLTVTLEGGVPADRLLEASFELSRILLARQS